MRRALTPLLIGALLVAGCGVDKKKLRDRDNRGSSAAGSTTTPPGSGGGTLPEARAEHTAILLPSGEIFVAGGLDATGTPLASTVLVTLTAVTPGPDMSSPRVGHSASFDATTGTVILAGGQADAAGATVLDTTDVFDPTTGTMSAGPALATARAHHTSVVFPAQAGLQILYAGGVGPAVTGPPAPLADAEILDVATGASAPVGAMTEAQKDAQGLLLDSGELLVASGEGTNGAAAAQIYDPANRTFRPLAAASRYGGAIAAQGREIYMAGGLSVAGPVSDGELYDSALRSFAPLPALTEARAYATGNALSSGMAVVGGSNAAGASGAVDVIAGAPLTATPGPALTTPRWAHTSTATGNDVLVVIGGYDVAGVPTDSIESVDLAALVSATAPPTAPPTLPPGTITAYPHFDTFDSGMGLWVDATGDDFDWSQNSGATPSLDTGPTADHSGSGQYLYTEASYPNDNGKVAILEGPTFGLFTTLEMRFWYHMLAPTTGYTMGTLSVDVSVDGGQTWNLDEWTLTGNQGANWQEAVVDFSGYAGQAIKVRFRGTTDSFNSDMSIDDVSFSDVPGPVTPPPPPPPAPPAVTAFPYAENFDAGLGLWTQSNTDDFDWDPNTGGTGSTNTGPDFDHTSGTGQYVYTESSYPNDTGQVAILEGPTFGNFSTLELRFWYHMLGDVTGTTMGSLSLDVSTDGGQTWTLDAWTLSGTQGANWQEAIVDLSSYAGQTVTLRFRGVTASYRSDMALDDISVTGTP